jgi:transcriptional regulator with XRE-family HTH domain
MKKKFAARLKELRAENQWSQKELAKKVHLSQSAITDWERGARKPGLDKTEELADLFKVSVDYLLGRTEKRGIPISIDELKQDHPQLAADLLKIGADYVMWDEKISKEKLLKLVERQIRNLN